jgi:hypothetical protein
MIMEQTYKVGRGIAAMTAEEMGAQLEGNAGAIPAEYAEEVQELLDEVKAKLVGHVEKNVRKAMQHNGTGNGAAPLEGEVTLATGYEFWDLLTLSPQQLIAPPVTFRPQKIVAGGEPALLLAVLFINPLPTPFGGPSATQYLGGRPFRVRLEQVDLTNVADVPRHHLCGCLSWGGPGDQHLPGLHRPAESGPQSPTGGIECDRGHYHAWPANGRLCQPMVRS